MEANQSLQATPVGAGLEVWSRRPGVPELGRSVSFDAPGGFPEMHGGESDASFRVGALLEADIWCHGRISTLGFQSRGEWDQDGTGWRDGLPDQFAAADRRGFDFREDQMRDSENGIPNQSLQATPVGAGLEVLSHRPGVPELGRSVSFGIL